MYYENSPTRNPSMTPEVARFLLQPEVRAFVSVPVIEDAATCLLTYAQGRDDYVLARDALDGIEGQSRAPRWLCPMAIGAIGAGAAYVAIQILIAIDPLSLIW